MAEKKKSDLALTGELVNIGSPAELLEFAKTLKTFIIEQELYTNISGKNYVHVEGWQFAGAVMGMSAVVTKVERLEFESAEGEVKYRAEVEIVKDGDVIGSGIAICSNRETKKRSFDEYAVASMAQTRAIGKAYRNLLGWLMKLAGYEAIPSEEMDGGTDGVTEEVIEKIEGASSTDELEAVTESLTAKELKAATAILSARAEALQEAA